MRKILFFFILTLLLVNCTQEALPKPRGHLRLEYPKPSYTKFNFNHCPFTFEYSKYASIKSSNKNCWYNVNYNNMKATIYLSYIPIENNLDKILKDDYELISTHYIKAGGENNHSFSNVEKKVFGNMTELGGQTASNIHFSLTDSTNHFLSGSLYFHVKPEPDSLKPAINYIKKDVEHLINTFSWK